MILLTHYQFFLKFSLIPIQTPSTTTLSSHNRTKEDKNIYNKQSKGFHFWFNLQWKGKYHKVSMLFRGIKKKELGYRLKISDKVLSFGTANNKIFYSMNSIRRQGYTVIHTEIEGKIFTKYIHFFLFEPKHLNDDLLSNRLCHEKMKRTFWIDARWEIVFNFFFFFEMFFIFFLCMCFLPCMKKGISGSWQGKKCLFVNFFFSCSFLFWRKKSIIEDNWLILFSTNTLHLNFQPQFKCLCVISIVVVIHILTVALESFHLFYQSNFKVNCEYVHKLSVCSSKALQLFIRTTCELRILANDFTCLGPKIYNQLPLEIREINRYNVFKQKLKKFLLENKLIFLRGNQLHENNLFKSA